MFTLAHLKNPAKRWIAIKAMLQLRGLCLSNIAQQLGVGRPAISKAAHTSYPNVERAIANALGLKPQQIWPERYDRFGQPIRQRPNAPIRKHYNSGTRRAA